MSDTIIRVKNISKKYRIRHQQAHYFALRDVLARCLKKPFEFFKKKNLNNSREDFWALKNVSFDVKEGEVVGVIGRNGSGKTTLLKMLSRITYPTEGEIRLRGRVGSLLEVGTGFHMELSGRENIYLNGSIVGMKKREIDKKFDEIVEFSGVEKFLDTPVKRYSSGMHIRLAFSVAAHLEPEILLVDEVLAVGDVQFQQKCLGKMKDVSKSGRTILFVSHNMAAIRKLCKRTILLDHGQKIMDADSETVISGYLDRNFPQEGRILGKELDNRVETARGWGGRPSVRLSEVCLMDSEGNMRSRFRSDESIVVRMSYECLCDVRNLQISVHVVNEENEPIMVTQNIDDPGELGLYQRPLGDYHSSFVIPPDIFGEKSFYISVLLVYPGTEHLAFNKILKFDVDFQGYSSVQDGKISKSFIRPRLAWQTQAISENMGVKQ
ncbi:MAG: ABC transporter ATP-binding protein [Candidatus Omnitrophota bacterium]